MNVLTTKQDYSLLIFYCNFLAAILDCDIHMIYFCFIINIICFNFYKITLLMKKMLMI